MRATEVNRSNDVQEIDASEESERAQTLLLLRHADCLVTLGQVAARVAHDVGTPLAVIAGRSSMLANGQMTGDDLKRSAVIIAEQAERIREVLQRLVELTRPRAGTRERRAIGALVDQAVSVVSPLLRARRLELQATVPDREVVPRADGRPVLQVLTNLMAHAVERAAEGSSVELAVEALEIPRGQDPRVPPGSHVRVQIRHLPAQIGELSAPQVFDMFHVAQAHLAASYFGIAVSDAVVRAHGGRVTFEQRDEHHCSTFHLPVEPA
jgi:K+-sensing histidine kinase KdpD